MKRSFSSRHLTLGTRASPLALAQAEETKQRLLLAHGWKAEQIEILPMTTTGDERLEKKLGEIGGKGLFTKEIEQALLEGRVDLAVHSMKDMPTQLPDGLKLACYLPREDVRDALICPEYDGLENLPKGGKIGTASLRRQAQLRRLRPDLEPILFRGNVQTRLRKLSEGVAFGTVLAFAGLKRLGMLEVATQILEPNEMLPAVAQGAIGLEIRAEDAELETLLAPLNCAKTALELSCERGFLAALDGSCRTPIAGLARLSGQKLAFIGEALTPDGRLCEQERGQIDGVTPEKAEALGTQLGSYIRARISDDFFSVN